MLIFKAFNDALDMEFGVYCNKYQICASMKNPFGTR